MKQRWHYQQYWNIVPWRKQLKGFSIYKINIQICSNFRWNSLALPPLSIMNSTVATVESFRFLGTTISQDQKWDNHIDSIAKKAQQLGDNDLVSTWGDWSGAVDGTETTVALWWNSCLLIISVFPLASKRKINELPPGMREVKKFFGTPKFEALAPSQLAAINQTFNIIVLHPLQFLKRFYLLAHCTLLWRTQMRNRIISMVFANSVFSLAKGSLSLCI